MKVLTITDSFHTGGKERRLIELLKGLIKRNIECELIVLSDVVQYEELYDLGIPIHFLKRTYKKDISIFKKIYSIIKKSDPDIVQSWATMASIYVTPIVKLLNIKFVNATIADAPSHKSFFDQSMLRKKVTFPFSHAIVGNSMAGLKAYNAPLTKSYAFHNGFDLRRIGNLIPKEDIRQKFNIKTKFVVGMVGKFEDRKDYTTYINAAVKIVQERNDITFLAIGDGNNLKNTQKLVDEKLRDRIIFTGRQTKVESIINLFDIGVLTTNDKLHGEGISNAILEYMVLAKPVVASKGGGTSEIIEDQKTGFIIRPYDVEELVRKIALLIEDETLRLKMGEASAQRIHEHFSLEKMTDSYLNLYKSLVKVHA
ncbi:glycosyltransferase involved in cell wall biosynthesis [Catalinimonas alkaloidigena]|uniref:glycosyltransferase n=1 Tax=Catalinimonas alkaloidigena TaxID=1075417 RepID=UPI002405431C|nr:glycosyltransferase [Catalinimonas alkaloidigena]MDF9796754.1 glycosyltransferase involved in cell wall biosynthesis [Catalinimonas alkaloidigena]